MSNAPTILDLFRLDNKVALVTGAASGLGAAVAIALAQAGARVAVHGNRRAATETAEQINASGGEASAFGQTSRTLPVPSPCSAAFMSTSGASISW